MSATNPNVLSQPLGRIELLMDPTGGIWVKPPADRRAKPFELPKLSEDLVNGLVALACTHFVRTQHCMATLLLINVVDREWSSRVPLQRCGSHAASWRPDRLEGLVIEKDHCLGGSFQSVVANDPSEVADFVPPQAGMHVIEHFWRESYGLLGFLRLSDERLIPMDLDRLVNDETNQLLDACADRMRLD